MGEHFLRSRVIVVPHEERARGNNIPTSCRRKALVSFRLNVSVTKQRPEGARGSTRRNLKGNQARYWKKETMSEGNQ